MLTKFHNSKFEFIFTSFVRDSPRLFATIQTVFRAYDTSRMYRDLKLRGAVISDKELKLLPLEQIYSQVGCLNSLDHSFRHGTKQCKQACMDNELCCLAASSTAYTNTIPSHQEFGWHRTL